MLRRPRRPREDATRTLVFLVASGCASVVDCHVACAVLVAWTLGGGPVPWRVAICPLFTASAVAAVAIPLNWIQHILVEVGVMLDATAAAVLALAVHHSVVERLAVAVLLAAQVMGHWIQTEEPDQ